MGSRSSIPDPLPTSTAAFRRLVAACRTEDQRGELLDRVRAEYPSFQIERHPWPRRPSRLAPASRRFEERLLEIIRTPRIARDFGWGLQSSHSYAWYDLTRLRSPRFASMLRRWMDGDDDPLAAKAAEHLALMTFDRDVPRLVRAMTRGHWRLRGAVGEGLAATLSHRWASRSFRTRMFEALAAIAAGEVPIPRGKTVARALGQIGDGLRGLSRTGMMRLYGSARVLHPRNRAVAGAVSTLEFEQGYRQHPFRPVDPRLLWPVYEALRNGHLRLLPDLETEPEATLGRILQLTADLDPGRTERECRAILRGAARHETDTLARYAAAALRRCRNIPEADAVLRAAGRRGAIRGDALKVIRAYGLVRHVGYEGLASAMELYRDDLPRAREGLLVLGQGKAASIVADAVRVFGKSAYAKLPRSRREDEELDEATAAALRGLDGRLSRYDRAVNRAVERYIEEHPAAFKAAAPRQG